MNFFSAQEEARRRTAHLVGLFALAIVLIALAVYAAVSVGFVVYQAWEHPNAPAAPWWSFTRLWVTLVTTTLVILGGSMYKQMQLSRGGHVVARELGAHQVKPATRNPLHRRLYNVVEEMAIASGVPVPDVFVFEHEYGINALAAGFTIDDAAIAVTQGALQALSRDELQGVVAHEFSHILNGDMRMNTKLMGWLHGILMLTLLGQVLRSPGGSGFSPVRTYHVPRARRSGGSGGRGGGGALILAIVVVAILVTIIGYIGAFVARRIKAAISRQREYLADAAAVQFTRNPGGIGGALLKIGGLRNGGHIRCSRAEEASHFFFANPMWMAKPRASGTHPPLPDRVLRIMPTWNGEFPTVERPGPEPLQPLKKESAQSVVGDKVVKGMMAAVIADQAGAAMQSPPPLPPPIPDELRAAAHAPETARELLLSMLLDNDPVVREAQVCEMANIQEVLNSEVIEDFYGRGVALTNDQRLGLADMLLPTLKGELSAAEYVELSEWIDRLIRWDHRTTALEFLIRRKFRQALGPATEEVKTDQGQIEYTRARDVAESASLLLSFIAREATPDLAEARQKFEQAVERSYMLNGQVQFRAVDEIDFEQADAALDQMRHASFALRRHLLESANRCAVAGAAPTPSERSLLRIFSQALGCPLPTDES